jgi:hypothetical protein
MSPLTHLAALQRRRVAEAGSVTATDTFNRADATPMSTTMSDGVGTWTSGPGATGDLNILSNTLRSPGTQRAAIVTAPSFAANHRAQITLTASVTVGVVLRMQSASDASGYLIYLPNSTKIAVYKITDTGTIALTQLGVDITITAVTAGDTIGGEITGTTITILRNGVSQGTRTDATYATGQPGVYIGASAATVDTYEATDI